MSFVAQEEYNTCENVFLGYGCSMRPAESPALGNVYPSDNRLRGHAKKRCDIKPIILPLVVLCVKR